MSGTVKPAPPILLKVRFLRALAHYLPRDIAMVPHRAAGELIRRRIVELVEPE